MTPRIVIAHRSALVRDVLRLLAADRDVVVVAEARSAGALAELADAERPDVVFAEATFEDGSEIEAVLARLAADGVRVVVVCDDPSPERLTRILTLGAAGYFRTDTAPEQVLEALQAVAGGASVLGPEAAAVVLEQWRRLRESGAVPGSGPGGAPAVLTAREAEILGAMAEGLGAKLIAARLGVAVKTVENHKIRIFDKLGVRSQAQAVSLAITHGLLAAPVGAATAAATGEWS